MSSPVCRALATAVSLASVGCGPRADRKPAAGVQPVLELPAEGVLPSDEVVIGHDRRRALLGSARFRARVPRNALLSFALATVHSGEDAPRGFVRLSVRVDGRLMGERRTNPRASPGFRATSLAFEGPGRPASLELNLALVDARGQPIPAPAGVRPGAADLFLIDRDALPDRRGVVFVSIDTLRRDHVSFYGYPKPTTPHLDAWARTGLVFDDAVSVSSWTLPAHFTMMTSVEPAAHGAVHSKVGFNHRVPTLAAILRSRGFRTHAITSAAYVSPRYGFDDGFDQTYYVHDRPGRQVADLAIDFLNRLEERPFFLFLHFYDPHWPYAPPEGLLRYFESGYSGPMSAPGWTFADFPKEKTTAADLAHVKALYDGEIRSTDAQLNRVLEHLTRRGLGRHTLLIVTSDHGEGFLEHGEWSHGHRLYEELIRIPLLLHGSGVPAGRVPEQVSLMDLAPTVLDWLGLPPRPEHRGRSLLGRREDRDAYGETSNPQGMQRLFLRAGHDRWKVVLEVDRRTSAVIAEEWYDLGRDPGETLNAPPPAAAAEAIRRRLVDRWRASSRQGEGTKVDLAPAEIEQLRAVGYFQN
jgi:arylsulfatase A-like enzyme